MSTILVSKYRIYCITEGTWVETWGITEPSTCSNNTAHTVNSGSVQILESIDDKNVKIVNTYQDIIETQRTAEQTPIIDLKSFHGISKENKVVTTGTGAVTATSESTAEIRMRINGSSDTCILQSNERGYYIAGLVSECGIALRLPTALDTSQILKFGYFDDNNGYYFKLVGNTLNVGIMNNGSETLIAQTDFNKDKLDGTTSRPEVDLTKGNIFRISFTWYGFGMVDFGVIQTDLTNKQSFVSMHSYTTNGST